MTQSDHSLIDHICSLIPERLRSENRAKLTAWGIRLERDAFNAGVIKGAESAGTAMRMVRENLAALDRCNTGVLGRMLREEQSDEIDASSP